MPATRPGEWLDPDSGLGLGLEDVQPGTFNTTIRTDRYTCPEYAAGEREKIWMRAWQIVGRVDELPKPGDWKKYDIMDQSFIIVRGKDEKLRGFVNACRHRGNALCITETGNAKRGFLCQYHLWSYDLEGRLKGLLRENLAGPIDKTENSLLAVSVDTFAGFIFLNPDPEAQPLREYLGEDVVTLLEPYNIDKFTTVMDVTEAIECNWKVVMDAFEEGYHINGIHPQLLQVLHINPRTARYRFFENHSVAMAPFEVTGASAQEQVEGMLALPETFPGTVAVIPRFQELLAPYQDEDGKVTFPDDVTPRLLLQQATREVLTGMGLDVSALTDSQMVDNQGWVLFPNYFMTVRAGECHVIMSRPHPDGDPNRCIWHVASYMYVPEDFRDAVRAEAIFVDTPGSYKYFEALQQDYEQMPRQQKGLRNDRLDHMSLVKEEVVIAQFHSVIDRYMANAATN
ncbi:aromatic ring-hydroxylating dioxygenase subunit alpha [Mycolicibacterium novocastrense]|uniref:Aromatic ring-hydroxylating dioxygenase subunit alpha n=1 Tax=Mycolicibacterium novocastrense TaxID=59813 RepID=A0AAW5SQA2_MYCNV|nr:aromatic ring-hydroxylating dioxygenase subunit alpha [Mycolicibacterium novocastrense]MCV7025479.1 aromatic ring-hydroxylating dioxygenase subunit alpha [Mycolicibacterium novocastrense]GAT08965.1 Rieske (2Fe-2S) domain-containing protein [Mycolicibacterium novocastrense]